MNTTNWFGLVFVIAGFLGVVYFIIFCKKDDELDKEIHDIENQEEEQI